MGKPLDAAPEAIGQYRLHHCIAFCGRNLSGFALGDTDGLDERAIREENATVLGAERMQPVGRNNESQFLKALARNGDIRDRENQMVDQAWRIVGCHVG